MPTPETPRGGRTNDRGAQHPKRPAQRVWHTQGMFDADGEDIQAATNCDDEYTARSTDGVVACHKRSHRQRQPPLAAEQANFVPPLAAERIAVVTISVVFWRGLILTIHPAGYDYGIYA